MRFEPPIDRGRLLEAVRQACGIQADRLDFLPLGLGSACYLLHGPRERRAFLKLWPHLRLGEPAAERQYATLVLTRALHDRGLGVRVPYPEPARDGALWADLAGMPFAVFPFLAGGRPPEQWPVALYEELGGTIAAIHRATPALAGVLPPREVFAIAFEADVRRDLDAAAGIGPGARPGLRAAREWVLERREDVLAQLARLHHLQATVERLDGPFVLCHTDLHHNNLLVDGAGHLAVLDWDDAKVAPPEHDLAVGLDYYSGGDGFGAVLHAYRRAGGAAPLHIEHCAFYLLRRYLEDTAVYLSRLLAADADEREDAQLLRGMDESGFARCSRLDATLDLIRAALPRDGCRCQ